MATPYTKIYERALFRLSDTKLARLNDADRQYVLRRHMQAAISDFQSKCLVDLSMVDDESCEFLVDLDNEVQEILALGISYYWLSAQILNNELLKNKLSTKDYQYFSPANLLRESTALREDVRKEYQRRIVQYTYDHGDLAMKGTAT